MKKVYFTIVIGSILLSVLHASAQDASWKRNPKNPNPPVGYVTAPFKNTTNTNARTSTVAGACDGQDVRVYPSANPQSEVHISINRNNPQFLVISANTYTTNYQQGRYVSSDGGNSWTGSDELISGTPVGGDPSTAFDATGNIFISSIKVEIPVKLTT